MKQNVSSKGGGLTISRRVTRSTTTLDLNSLTLPVEVVTEILSRLPLKSIAICRCVCKLWSSILRSQDFTDSFLTRSCARPRLLFVFQGDKDMVLFSSPQPENPEENSCVVASNHLARFPCSFELFGCTNGFLRYGAASVLIGKKMKYYVPVICNPSTGQSLTLPNWNPRLRFLQESFLGYEPIAKEFKVLLMESSHESGISVEHRVLTLGTKKLSRRRLVECCVPHSPSRKWICISGVLYYTAAANKSSRSSMVVCFDLRSEKLSFVNFVETFSEAMQHSTTVVNYNGKLGLLMSRDSPFVDRASTSLELWVLQDTAKHEWSKHVYILPPSWEDVVSETMCISGLVGTNEIVFSPTYQRVPPYVIYYNVERKTITKVGIQGMEALRGRRLYRIYTYLNYVENVILL